MTNAQRRTPWLLSAGKVGWPGLPDVLTVALPHAQTPLNGPICVESSIKWIRCPDRCQSILHDAIRSLISASTTSEPELDPETEEMTKLKNDLLRDHLAPQM